MQRRVVSPAELPDGSIPRADAHPLLVSLHDNLELSTYENHIQRRMSALHSTRLSKTNTLLLQSLMLWCVIYIAVALSLGGCEHDQVTWIYGVIMCCFYASLAWCACVVLLCGCATRFRGEESQPLL